MQALVSGGPDNQSVNIHEEYPTTSETLRVRSRSAVVRRLVLTQRLVMGDMTFLDSGAQESVALPARLFGEQEENFLDRLHAWLGS